ncbi:Heat shock 70 kDa protein 12B [Pseudocercospora fuligena]|uniref:Heat shock 70 kDa protein 12B n=1 Tax=Pseudocercospora fuligena TaxID=685502 RepID=A0A8H6VEU8_9PEZI|nr:Heat shock 70 kDa protein 12B [Pseudocercospora fuligena]
MSKRSNSLVASLRRPFRRKDRDKNETVSRGSSIYSQSISPSCAPTLATPYLKHNSHLLKSPIGSIGSSRIQELSRKLHKIIVGVDFGTTYTGVSWVTTEDATQKTVEDIICIRDWPGPVKDADFSWKTPSCISYGTNNDIDHNTWGYEVLPRMKCFSWMKLLLEPQQASKYDVTSLTVSVGAGVLDLPEGKTPVELCADFLREIVIFAYGQLSRRHSEETLSVTPLEFWFTVPAVWSDKAKMQTLHAIQRAGVLAGIPALAGSEVYLIREPEAAAIATLSAQSKSSGVVPQVRTGDSVLICDCGGGTVDITTYKVTQISPKLEFEELLVGVGGKCGSTYIDREFMAWMDRQFGTSYANLPVEKRGPRSRFMRDFESHKRDFGKAQDIHDESRYYEMELVMKDVDCPRYYDEDNGTVKIYNKDFRRFFEPVIQKIKSLLASQIEADLRTFGVPTIKESVLNGLRQMRVWLTKCRRSFSSRNLRLLCPEHPQAAIAKGAALSGLLNIRPSSRKCRRHYGGDVVSEETKIELELEAYAVDGVPVTNQVTVYYCNLDVPPENRKDEGAHKLVTFECDTSKCNLNGCRSKMIGDEKVHSVPAVFGIEFGRKQGVLGFSCRLNGTEVGATTVTFDGQENMQDIKPCAVQ